MQMQQIIRRIDIQATTSNVDESAKKLGNLSDAQAEVGKSAEVMAVKTESAARRQLAVAGSFNRMSQQMSQQQAVFAQSQDDMNRSFHQAVAVNDNFAQSHSHVGDALRIGSRAALEQATSMATASAKMTAGILLAASLATILGGIYIAYKLVKTGIDLVTASWDEGAKQLERYVEIGKQAASLDVSTDFAQRIIKGAEDAKLSVDDLLKSMQKLQDVSADKLGGSALQNRLGELQGAGNFQGNTGTAQLAAANTTEEKFRAIVSLIDQAMQKGERLAALDVAGTALGPQVAANLAKNSDYLNNMLATADKLKATELVSQESINNATILQQRYDAALKVLETRWAPLQSAMVAVGITLREIWVGIVEAVAAAVNAAAKAIEGAITQDVKDVMAFVQLVKNGISIAKTGFPEQQGPAGLGRDQLVADQRADAEKRLAAGLANTNAVQRSRVETEAVYNAVLKDTSKNTGGAAAASGQLADAYSRALESVMKHTARLEADAKAVGLGVAAQEEFRASATLMNAAQQASIPITQKMRDQIQDLAQDAGEARLALEKLRINDQIKFDRQTLGLSAVDVQIAQQLRGIYSDVGTALDSVEAAAIRMNRVLTPKNDNQRPADTKPAPEQERKAA